MTRTIITKALYAIDCMAGGTYLLLIVTGFFAAITFLGDALGLYAGLLLAATLLALMGRGLYRFFQDSKEIYCPEDDGWGEVCAPEGGQVVSLPNMGRVR